MSTPMSLPRSVANPSGTKSILLVHGLTSGALSWWEVAPLLTGLGYAVTTVDLRGHGFAAKADSYRMEDFAADLLAVTPLGGGGWDAVVGHSLGGVTSVVAASLNPDWTRRLVLLDPAILLYDHLADEYGREWPKQVEPATLAQIAAGEPHSHPMYHALRFLHSAQVTGEVVTRITADLKPWDGRAALTSLTLPILVLSADESVDPTFLQPEVVQIYTEKPNITLFQIVGAGHSVQRDDLPQTFGRIRDFLAE